jgi:IS5 family transposase
MAWKNIGNPSFADALVQSHVALEEFDEIDAMIDWCPVQKILSVISNSTVGEKAYPPLMMFKAILLQKWHNLSDPGLEKQLARDIVFKRFVGLSLSDPIPDHSTIHRFRQKLIERDLELPIFEEINSQLQNSGIMIQQGAISIIDASVVEAGNSRPKKNDKGRSTQDPEAAYTSKTWADGKRRTTYGYKNHLNVDEDGLIQKTICTAANVHDSTEFENLLTGTESAATADKAYYSEKHMDLLQRNWGQTP